MCFVFLVRSQAAQAAVYDLQTLYGKTYFELINAKISCKCRNKVRLPLHTVVLVFSVKSEGKFVSVLDGFVAFELLRCRHEELKAHFQPTDFSTVCFCYGNLYFLSQRSNWMNLGFGWNFHI